MNSRNKKNNLYMAIAGEGMVIWIALKIAPYAKGGLFGILNNFGTALSGNPFKFIIVPETVKTLLIMSGLYLFVAAYLFSIMKNKRPGEEYGSAKWADIKKLQKKYSQNPETDRILSENLRIGMDMYKHQRNLFTLIVGGAGSRKTRGYAIPNILQNNGSKVILDPKGENLRATGNALLKMGYKLKILDLIHMERSHRYNPFHYITCQNDVQRIATMIFSATGKKDSKPQDPYWENAAMEILMALMLYLYYEAPEEEQNFGMVMDMVRLLSSGGNDEEEINPLDALFLDLKAVKPEHPALKYYEDIIGLPNKTLQTIKSTLTAKLSAFNMDEVISLTMTDELEIDKIGEEKTALFCIIPDMDPSFNFIVSMLYSQMFQKLAYLADNVYHGPLPLHVHFIMDEFANVALPDDFDHVVSVIRSRNISVSIILQNMNQIKAIYEKVWETIVGNCDTYIYLGGNEQSTHKYVSELLDKETIDTNTYGMSRGMHGSFTTNDQKAGRELMQPGEVRKLSRDKCIVMISGEEPAMDFKYDLQSHPLIHETPLAKGKKGKPYTYGNVTLQDSDVGIIGYMYKEDVSEDEIYKPDTTCQILTEEDINNRVA